MQYTFNVSANFATILTFDWLLIQAVSGLSGVVTSKKARAKLSPIATNAARDLR